jgi:DeoR/GlpR family transcriptional regulator of sugar metabolism
MFSIERHQAILNLLNSVKSITVKELSSKLQTGEATIRRDLAKLEKSGLLKRTHGGAVLDDNIQGEIPLTVRESDKETEKKLIAGHASNLINDGEFIILDSSSTTLRMIPYLKKINNLTVMTNGAKTAVDLANLQNIKVYSTGGLLREKSLSFIGQTANFFLNDFNADLLFFSCRALSMEKGLSDFDEQEAFMRKEMMKASKKTVLLCDHSKFDETSFYRIDSVNCLDTIITDIKPNRRWVKYLDEQQIELIY